MASAEDLRTLASEIRVTSTGLTESANAPRVDIDQTGPCDACKRLGQLVASYPDGGWEPWLCAPCAAEADHAASWTQPVALAVAALLDGEALRREGGNWAREFDEFAAAWRGQS